MSSCDQYLAATRTFSTGPVSESAVLTCGAHVRICGAQHGSGVPARATPDAEDEAADEAYFVGRGLAGPAGAHSQAGAPQAVDRSAGGGEAVEFKKRAEFFRFFPCQQSACSQRQATPFGVAPSRCKRTMQESCTPYSAFSLHPYAEIECLAGVAAGTAGFRPYYENPYSEHYVGARPPLRTPSRAAAPQSLVRDPHPTVPRRRQLCAAALSTTHA